MPSTTTCVLGANYSSQKYKLLEVNPNILEELRGGRVCIKGEADEEAVLCTQNKNYVIRFVESSNSNLLLRCNTDLQQAMPAVLTVSGAVDGHYELVETPPRTSRIKALLLQRPYGLEDPEEITSPGRLYTTADLVELVQASEADIHRELESLGAFEIDGYWRLLDDSVCNRTLEAILEIVSLKGWDNDAIIVPDLMDALSYLDDISVRQCLQIYTTPVSMTDSDASLCALNTKRISIQRAVTLLQQSQVKRMPLDLFLETWRQLLEPNNFVPDLQDLKGVALVDAISDLPAYVSLLEVHTLPTDPRERFKLLFSVRSKWLYDDIEPYIRGICGPNQTVEQLLVKHARATLGGGKVSATIYTQRT